MTGHNFRYVPTGQGEDGWGASLDQAWAPHFNPAGSRRFWADAYTVTDPADPLGTDIAVCHSIALPGETYAARYLGWTRQEVRDFERTLLARFGAIYTFSAYLGDLLRSELGLANYAGVLAYPVPARTSAPVRCRRVTIAQRHSEEKLPLIVLELARRMPDVEFAFCAPREPSPLRRVWFEVAPPNVRVHHFTARSNYLAFLGETSCGLVATLRDNFGVSAIDCLSAGRPYVAPRLLAYPEFIADDACLYAPFDLTDMARAVEHALALETPTPPRIQGFALAEVLARHDCAISGVNRPGFRGGSNL